MARAPNEKVIKAEELFKKGYKLIEISKELDIPEGTIRSWKNRYNWDNEKNATLQKKEDKKRNVANKKDTSKSSKANELEVINNKKSNATYKTRSCPNNARPRNKNSETHGFFSKYLPQDTIDIIKDMKDDPVEILWQNIQIHYAAIIRSQNIMYVKSQDDMTKELTGETNGDTSSSERYTVQFAWDKQANFLQAQSRAMGELRSLIKQHDELSRSGLVTEEQKLRIEKIKADVIKLAGTDKDKEQQKGNMDKLIEVFNKGPVIE